MQETPKKIGFLLLLLHSLTFFLIFSPTTQNPQGEEESHYCSKIKTRDLYLSPISNQSTIVATNLITCRSGKLYFKTSIGLFHVSSIDHATKTLILSHSSGSEKVKKLGARVSLEVEGHLPDICIACERPDGNCGVALRCLCHPKECKIKVVNIGTKSRALSDDKLDSQNIVVRLLRMWEALCALCLQALGHGVDIQLGMAMDSSKATLAVKRRLSCEMVKYCEKAAAYYYYHDLILDEGNTEKSHGMAVAALQAADECFKERKKESI